MNHIHQTIINSIVKKADKVCPDSLALIGIYGSVATGDDYHKSDLDLMILINDDNGWKLGCGFILDDTNIMQNIHVYDIALEKYKKTYDRAGISPKHFANVDEFTKYYLSCHI